MTASPAVKASREFSFVWMQMKEMAESSAAKNWRLAAGEMRSQSPAVSVISSPSMITFPWPARMPYISSFILWA